MDKRQAKREAYRLAALLIEQAQESAMDGWSDDPAEDDRITAALAELAGQLRARGMP